MKIQEHYSPRRSIENLWKTLQGILTRIGWVALAGFIGALVLLFLFAELSEEVFKNESASLDKNVGLWSHSFSNPALDFIFNFFTLMGGIPGITALTILTFAVLVLHKNYFSAWILALAVGGGVAINQVLKLLFHRTRPDLWDIYGRPTTYSFPSGHATVSLCYFGILAWLGYRVLERPLARAGWLILMLLFPLLIGLSRIYLGVHYFTDIIGGYLAAGFWLLVLLNGFGIYQRIQKAKKAVTAREQ